MKRKIISYDLKLKKLARKLRQNMTFSEVKVWNELKNGQMMDCDFDRQKPIDKYIVDFYCKDLLLVIEIDGITHDDEIMLLRDEVRQKELENIGIKFLRFDALKVVHDIENIMRSIQHWILDYEDKYGIHQNVLGKRKSMNPPLPPPTEGMRKLKPISPSHPYRRKIITITSYLHKKRTGPDKKPPYAGGASKDESVL